MNNMIKISKRMSITLDHENSTYFPLLSSLKTGALARGSSRRQSPLSWFALLVRIVTTATRGLLIVVCLPGFVENANRQHTSIIPTSGSDQLFKSHNKCFAARTRHGSRVLRVLLGRCRILNCILL